MRGAGNRRRGWGVVVVSHREQQCASRHALALVAARLLVLTCVAFMLLELVLVITKRESIPSQLLVLVDTSESMGLSDPYQADETASRLAGKLKLDNPAALQKQPRLELARRAVAEVLPRLSQGREAALYGFAQQPLALKVESLKSVTAQGTGTAIGDAISAALAEHRGQPLAGLLLVSDGQSNAGEDPRKVAEHAAKLGVPVVSLAVGTVEGPSNARLAAIEADPVVFVRDTAEVSVLVEAHGMRDRTGVVVLEKRQDSGWSEVGREEITFDEDTAARRVRFEIKPEAVGEIEFRATWPTWAPS